MCNVCGWALGKPSQCCGVRCAAAWGTRCGPAQPTALPGVQVSGVSVTARLPCPPPCHRIPAGGVRALPRPASSLTSAPASTPAPPQPAAGSAATGPPSSAPRPLLRPHRTTPLAPEQRPAAAAATAPPSTLGRCRLNAVLRFSSDSWRSQRTSDSITNWRRRARQTSRHSAGRSSPARGRCRRAWRRTGTRTRSAVSWPVGQGRVVWLGRVWLLAGNVWLPLGCWGGARVGC